MAATLTLKRFSTAPDGTLQFLYDYVGPSGDSEHEVRISPSALAMHQATLEGEENVFRLMTAWWQARSADFSNTAVIMNKDFTVDLGSPNPIRVQ